MIEIQIEIGIGNNFFKNYRNSLYMAKMLIACSLEQINLSVFKNHNVTMSEMFIDCSSLIENRSF